MKKLIGIITAFAVSSACLGSVGLADGNPKDSAITADKTAQWTYQESAAAYDLRVHGWSEWETAAYIGFTLPDSFSPDLLTGASLVLNTVSASNAGTAYLYAADYSAFTSGQQYEGDEIPAYTAEEFTSFTSPVSSGDFTINITSYMSSLSSDTSEVAFRIDVKSQNTNNNWVIGSLTNSGTAPVLKLEYGEPIITNANFSNDTNGWTITNSSKMSVSDGVLKVSAASGEAELSQKITGLDNGTYDLTATVTGSIPSESDIAYLYAKAPGHTMARTAIPYYPSASAITVPGVTVDNGTLSIGLYANGTQAITLDNLTLTPSDSTRVPFLKGGEISKLTYLEECGPIKYKDADGNERDCLQIMAENGFNLARIRLLNNPGKGHGDGSYYLPAGYMDLDDCLDMAKRAKDKGMQIEFTFAYSDYWVDGATQMPPVDWADGASGLSGSALADYYAEQIYEYTKEVLQKLKDQGTEPEFVSIGNEMQYGMCFGLYKTNNGLYNNAAYIAQLANAGAKAVREECPEAKIILHTDNGGKVSARTQFVRALSNIDFDVIGVSFYPYYNSDVSIDTVVSEFATLINQYDKDVIIMETGYNWTELRGDGWEGQLQDSGYYQNIYGETQQGQKAFLTELYAKLKQVLGGRCIGDLYWDPIMAYDNSSWTNGKGYNTGWAIRESDDTTDVNVVSNSDLFDFSDRALPAFDAMKYNTNANDKVLVSGTISRTTAGSGSRAANTDVTITINGTAYSTTTDAYGQYIVAIDYPETEKISVTAADSSGTAYTGSYYEDAPAEGVLLPGIDFPAEAAAPTITPTATPTAAPTDVPTTAPTDAPTAYSVEYSDDGTAAVTAPEAGSYTVIFAAYKDGRPVCIEIADISFDAAGIQTVEPESFTADGADTVKIMLWDDLMHMQPKCRTDIK